MARIIDCEQGSSEWLQCRIGKVTASELSNIVTPEFSARKGDMVKSYMCEKLAEQWFGRPLPQFSTWETEQGKLREDDAWKWLALTQSLKVSRVGFVEHESGRFGASPDGLIGEDGGLEIKCPQLKNHFRYLMDGEVPKDYLAQVHGSLYATGRKWWKFISYYPGAPALVFTVNRDEAIIAKIDAALSAFYAQYNAAMQTLKGQDR